jgi:hypothetical protein
LGNKEGLAGSLANQALIVNTLGDTNRALKLATDAYEVAIQAGYASLAGQIDKVRTRIVDNITAPPSSGKKPPP